MFKVKPRATLGQGWPKPGTQGTDKSQRILANLDKTERTGRNGLKTGIFRQKRGKKRAKPGKKRANETEPWQKHGETESFAESRFGFGHPCSGPHSSLF